MMEKSIWAISRSRVATLLLALFLAIGLSAADARDTLHRSNPSEPDTLDPQRANIVPDQVVVADMFQGLIGADERGNLIPAAATHWDVSDDGFTWTFHLRDGLKWSDGTPVTAHDYDAGMHRLYAPETASPSAGYVYMIKNARAVNGGELPASSLGVRALGDKTLEVVLERPTPLFARVMTSVWFFPAPRHVIDKVGTHWLRAENYVSNGAFTLEDWSPNDKIVLVKNPHFIDADKVRLEKVVFHPAEDTEASLKRFRAGELDFVAGMPSHKIDFLRKNLARETRIGPRPANNFVVFNTRVAPFDDVRVRHALSLAIDRELYAEKVLRKGEVPAYRMVPSTVEHYQSAPLYFHEEPIMQRQARARALLEEAGYNKSSPLTFELRVRGSPDRKRGAVALQAMWRTIGVKAQILSTDLKVHYSDLNLGNFQAADAGFVSSTGPDLFLEEFISTNLQGNYSNYNNPEYDRILNAALQIADITERHRQMAIAEQLMLKDHPIAPVNFSVTGNLVATYLRGYEDNLYDAHESRYMWIEDEAKTAQAD